VPISVGGADMLADFVQDRRNQRDMARLPGSVRRPDDQSHVPRVISGVADRSVRVLLSRMA